MPGLRDLVEPMMADALGPMTGPLMNEMFPGGGARALNGRPGVRGNSDGSVEQNIQLAKRMAAKYGWTGREWRQLKDLWTKESGFRTDADNPDSSAYGIPQALTETHDLGKRYMNNPKVQIRWGLDYLKNRYGNPTAANRFHERENWY